MKGYGIAIWCVLFTILIFVPASNSNGVNSVPEIYIQALQGGSVDLPCDISIPTPNHQNDNVMLVLLYREDLGRYVYSVDARDRPFHESEKWSDENVFGNRAYFRSTSNPAVITIENVLLEDAALYRCRVDFKIGQTRNNYINLTVIVPPEPPIITDEKGIQRTMMIGPYTEGQSLSLQCHVYKGVPPPNVVWYRNGKLIDTSDYSSQNSMKNDLIIPVLRRSDLLAEFTCETTNNNLSRPLATTVHVDLNLNPLEVKIKGKRDFLTAGMKYDILCQSIGARPPAHITWWLGSKRLEADREITSRDGNTTSSTLSYVPRKSDSKKKLMCRASQLLEDNWSLQIHYKPEAELKLGSSLKGDNIKEGSDVYFDCLIDAYPPVAIVQWAHNEEMLSHDVTAGVIMTNRSLVLQKVTRRSAGNYSCMARNSEGQGESNQFFLDVLYSPTCQPNQIRVHGVGKLENVNITCDVDANPQNVKFHWTFNNSAESVQVSTTKYRTLGTQSVVTYKPMTELDYGTLLCWSKNKIGDQRIPCVYHIIAAGKPDMVQNCSVRNHSTDSFLLICEEGFNGGLPQSFLLELYDSNRDELIGNVTHDPQAYFQMTGLQSGQTFTAKVYAFNKKGRSDPFITSVYTMRLPEKVVTDEKENEEIIGTTLKLTSTQNIVIGVSLSLLLAIVSILLYNVGVKKRNLSNRDKDQEEPTAKTSSNHHSTYKIDSSDGLDSSEDKNPDIIPQGSSDPRFPRGSPLISTIQTSSPSHSQTVNVGPSNSSSVLQTYCTLRKGNSIRQHYSTLPSTSYQMPVSSGLTVTTAATTATCHCPYGEVEVAHTSSKQVGSSTGIFSGAGSISVQDQAHLYQRGNDAYPTRFPSGCYTLRPNLKHGAGSMRGNFVPSGHSFDGANMLGSTEVPLLTDKVESTV